MMNSELELAAWTTDIVSAYVSNNAIAGEKLPEFIGSIYTALSTVSSQMIEQPKVELKPAVPVKKSLTPEYLICLEDGKKFKSLKRHLQAHYGLSPDEYRQKWGLPRDYPMVAPAYAAARSNLAKTMGLGSGAAREKARPQRLHLPPPRSAPSGPSRQQSRQGGNSHQASAIPEGKQTAPFRDDAQPDSLPHPHPLADAEAKRSKLAKVSLPGEGWGEGSSQVQWGGPGTTRRARGSSSAEQPARNPKHHRTRHEGNRACQDGVRRARDLDTPVPLKGAITKPGGTRR